MPSEFPVFVHLGVRYSTEPAGQTGFILEFLRIKEKTCTVEDFSFLAPEHVSIMYRGGGYLLVIAPGLVLLYSVYSPDINPHLSGISFALLYKLKRVSSLNPLPKLHCK